jgi:hypothetical protein
MVRQRKDTRTLDLLTDWEPPEVTTEFNEVEVRGANLRTRIALAVAAALRDCEDDRKMVADNMSAFLGERCTKNMLDAYASPSRDDSVITLVRYLALADATGDAQRLLQALAAPFGLAVIESRYVPAIKDAMLTDKIDELNEQRKAQRRAWKVGR